jgi:hypothetical protein
MPTTFSLLRIVGKAVAKHTLNTVAFGLPLGDILFETAQEAMRSWKEQAQEEQRRAELQAMAHATVQELDQQVREIVRSEFAHLPPQAQEEVAGYLKQITANYRRKCTRLGGGGVAVVAPADLSDARELVSLLPEIPPSFRPSPRSRRLTDKEIDKLLSHDHSINGGILLGLDGYVVEVQGKAIRGLPNQRPWTDCRRWSGPSSIRNKRLERGRCHFPTDDSGHWR